MSTEDLTACPICGSGRLVCLPKTMFDCCLECMRVWERLPAEEPYLAYGEPFPFKVPCDNCAFRGGSQERADKVQWTELQQTLALGGEFYCHKGVPFRQPVGLKVAGEPLTLNPAFHAPGEDGFDFPKKPTTIHINGIAQTVAGYDRERMRLCRGYLNAHIAPLLQKELSDA